MGRPTKEKTGLKDLEILEQLALRGPLNCYETSVKKDTIVIPYPTVWRRLKTDKDSLLKTGMVAEVEDTKPKKYTLTALGLVKLLSHYSQDPKRQMNQIAEKWSSLLPPHRLFSKWSYLKIRGLEDGMIQILKIVRYLPDASINFDQWEGHLKWEDHLNIVVKTVFLSSLFPPGVPEVILRWYKAVRDDDELKQLLIKYLEEEIKAIHGWVEVYEKLLRTIKAPREPDLDDVRSITTTATGQAVVLAPRLPFYVP